ncbi:PLP-dependent aminotransferase family protein [Phenylobacterium immobile]|uniref:aminotransferase-like domain-containing protein n=1 Tax=Phenylobacterium immobile TaxID=21 RepID=UPI000AC704F8|nr:PLP-dependent aminotransferase family protein [Phenylobacterium immobile]
MGRLAAPASDAWLGGVNPSRRPVYLAIADAMAEAIRLGDLQPGDRLPAQRAVAAALGVDLTTVTRAYDTARARGLLESSAGRGAFVRARANEDEAGLADLSMNLPPPPEGVSLATMLRETTAAVLQRSDAATLMAYHEGAGLFGQRAAGAAWLAPTLGDVAPERTLVCAGAQAGLTAALSVLCKAGATLIVEPLTYPGVLAAARALNIRLVACDVDADGPTPHSLARLQREMGATAAYLIPTMQNPTGAVMPTERRREIARHCAAAGLWLIEDDPYSRLLAAPPPAIASFAPDQTFYLATLSKCLSPGLRTAYLACPPDHAPVVARALRAVTLMPAPLMTAVVTAWMREGQAETLLEGVRREVAVRRAIAKRVLPAALGSSENLHLWLPLPQSWSAERLRLAGLERGLALVAADAFASRPDVANGVRISLGGPGRRQDLERALTAVGAMLSETPRSRLVV